MGVKRGQVYSLIAILLAIPLFLFLVLSASHNTSGLSISDRITADQIHEVESSMENDLSRAMDITGRRALLAASNDVITKGIPLNNAESVLETLASNGTMNGSISYFMINNTIKDWRNKVLSVNTGFATDITYGLPLISVADSFDLLVAVNITANITDKFNTSRIDRSVNSYSTSSIEGTEDPIFPLNTLGYVNRKISEYTYPYYAKKIVSGTGIGGCYGNVTFDKSSPSPDLILVTNDSNGISGFRGVVSITGTPIVSCYITNASNAVNKTLAAVTESGYNELYLDNDTKAVWSLPIKQGFIDKKCFSEPGPNIIHRLQGSLAVDANGFQCFVDTNEMTSLGITPEANQSVVDYMYFSYTFTRGYNFRGLPETLKLDTASASIYGISDLKISE